jgi:hypothetical protein
MAACWIQAQANVDEPGSTLTGTSPDRPVKRATTGLAGSVQTCSGRPNWISLPA